MTLPSWPSSTTCTQNPSLPSDAISYALGCEQSFLAAMTPAQFVRTALASDPSRPFQVLRWSLRTAGDDAATGPLARSEHGDPAASSFRDASSDIQERLKLYQPLTIRVGEDSALSRAIEKFGVWAAGHGVSVYATWPNTIAFDAYRDDPAFNEIRTLYASKGIKLLGDPQAAMYPAALFYDTQYHLSRAGIEKRTRDLLAVLIDELADEPSKPKPTTSAEATFSETEHRVVETGAASEPGQHTRQPPEHATMDRLSTMNNHISCRAAATIARLVRGGAAVSVLASVLCLFDGRASAAEYRLGPADQVHIKVVEFNADTLMPTEWTVLTGDYRVDGGGRIMMPIVGTVSVVGLTVPELNAVIEGQVRKLIGFEPASPRQWRAALPRPR